MSRGKSRNGVEVSTSKDKKRVRRGPATVITSIINLPNSLNLDRKGRPRYVKEESMEVGSQIQSTHQGCRGGAGP